MKGSLLVLGLALFFGGYAVQTAMADSAAHREGQALVQAETLIAFSGFVRDYKESGQVLADGLTPSNEIPVPSWFVRDKRVVVFAQSGKEFVYTLTDSASDAAQVLEALDRTARWELESLQVGRSQGGRLVVLRSEGAPPLELPGAIPNNAVVIPVTTM